MRALWWWCGLFACGVSSLQAQDMASCALPEGGGAAPKASKSNRGGSHWPAVRLQLSLRRVPAPTGLAAERPMHPPTSSAGWQAAVDNGQALEISAAPAASDAAPVSWAWQGPVPGAGSASGQTVWASSGSPSSQTPRPSPRIWFCPAWPGGQAPVVVHFRFSAAALQEAGPAQPEVASRQTVALGEWARIGLSPLPAEPGGDRTGRSDRASAAAQVWEMRWTVLP